MSIPFYSGLNSWLKRDHLHRFELDPLLERIRDWYQDYQSIPKLRKAMKEAGYFTPFMELDIYDNQVIIRKFARKIRIDDVVGYTNYSSLELGRWITRTSSPDFTPTYQRSPEHAITQTYIDETTGYTHELMDWIERGNICECGNHFIDRNGVGECIICEQFNAPMSYSTRAEEILGHETTKEIKFGIELEYENVRAKQVKQSIGDHAIAKLDATISNGVEVVTRPACIKTHKEVLKKFFDAVNTKAHPNTGMHIHVEKAKLSQYQIGFMLWFINNEDNYTFLEKVAGRNFRENRYTSLQKGTKMTSFMYYDTYDNKLKRSESGKYVPLNTNKPKTYEFRIFRSPESHIEMSAKLDFVKALIDYASPYSVHVKSLKDKVKSENFLQFVGNHRKDYKDFVSYFKEMF